MRAVCSGTKDCSNDDEQRCAHQCYLAADTVTDQTDKDLSNDRA